MDSSICNSIMNVVQQKTPITKRTKERNNKKKSKNNQIKVVYISNPMKVKTSASEFRALVQELTGKYAELPPDPSKYQEYIGSDEGCGGGEIKNLPEESENCVVKIGHDHDFHHQSTLDEVTPPVDPNCGGSPPSIVSFEPFDDVFTPQMIESISSLLPSSVFYDSPQQLDQVLMQCNYVHP